MSFNESRDDMKFRMLSRSTPWCRGFTLLELLVVVALVALLTGLALPSYQSSMQRARRSDAREALLHGAQWLERVASLHGQYPEAEAYPARLSQSAAGHYRLRYAPGPDLASYSLTAFRQGAQLSDPCGDFVLDQAGQRLLLNPDAGSKPADCWRR